MDKKESAKVLIVGSNPQISNLAAEQETLLAHKPIRVPHCKKALKVASRHPSYFDLLFTDIMTYEANDEDFAKQFAKLSPETKVVYMIF
jgi:DNA-binding NtrC family response regulator